MTDTLTHAYTVRQPFAYATAVGWKPVENKDKRPPLALIGQLVGIHAGLQWARESDLPSWAKSYEMPAPTDSRLVYGALIGVARLVGVCRAHPDGPDVGFQEQIGRGNVWSDLDPEDCALIAPWAKPGHVLWRWREAVLLPEPILMRGQQGLWRINSAVQVGCRCGHPDCPAKVPMNAEDWALEQWRKARETR